MKRSFATALHASALVLSLCFTQAPAQSPPRLTVDVLATPSGTTFNTLRSAIAFHNLVSPNALQDIAIRGRLGPINQVVVHGDSVENWSTAGAIVIPRNVNIFWDVANSDLDPFGRRAPAVFSGAAAGTNATAFRMNPTDSHTRSNTTLKGIKIVAFATGIEWFPTTSGTVGATFRQIGFNQTTVGMTFSPLSPVTTIDALTTDCRFANVPQPTWIGGGRAGGITNLADHIRYYIASGGAITGQVDTCKFSSDTTNVITGSPVFTDAGIYMEIFQTGTLQPLILENEFLGNADTSLPGRNGMLYGVYVDVLGRMTDATFTIQQCWFEKCGFDGTMMFAGEQGMPHLGLLPGEFWFEQWFEYGYWSQFLLNPFYGAMSPHFLFPVITDCSYVTNGTLAPLFSIYPEDGHGVSLRTYDFGQLAMRVNSCDASGTSAGHPNVGITANARDGVYVSSDWYLPLSNNGYFAGAMRETRNNSSVQESEIFVNGRHGVTARLVDGSGNPGVKGNRIHGNAVNGVDFTSMSTVNLYVTGFPPTGPARTRVFSPTDDLANDVVIAQPFAWNNFIYNATATLESQQIGINEHTRSRTLFLNEVLPDVRSNTGIIHNSIVGQTVAGIVMRDVIQYTIWYMPPWVGTVAFGNISKFNAGGNPAADIVDVNFTTSILYNCNASYFGSSGNINADPLFANASVGDLHILATSPCVNLVGAHPPIGHIVDDFDLQARPYVNGAPPALYNDMGADEL